jgi:hypothetical protein
MPRNPLHVQKGLVINDSKAKHIGIIKEYEHSQHLVFYAKLFYMVLALMDLQP